MKSNLNLKTYYIQTFGCQMNYSDSERMAAYLEGIGLSTTDSWDSADLIVLNTCSVKQKAEDKVNGVVKSMRERHSTKDVKIVLTGCIARRIWDEKRNVQNSAQRNYDERLKELKKIFPNVDAFVETKHFNTLAEKLGLNVEYNDQPEHYLSFKPKYKNGFQAFVPISTGCNHFCTFCIVPYSRGKEICRPAEEIIREVFELVRAGYRDITLLGQTVNRWINPDFQDEFNYNEAMTSIQGLNERSMDSSALKEWRKFFNSKIDGDILDEVKLINLVMPKDFLQLLEVLDQIPGDWWTTWLSSHPNYMTDALIEFVGESSKGGGHQRPYLHFALQSGSNNQLRRMNRRYTFEEFYNRVKKIRQELPEMNLSTDIIVGFINESEGDFNETLEAEKLCRFDMIYISEYSPRPGTAAARLKDTISLEIKADRKNKLNDLLREIAKENNQNFVGTSQKVLVTNLHRKGNFLSGRTIHNKEVRIINSKDQDLVGQFINVNITKAGPWSLEAEM